MGEKTQPTRRTQRSKSHKPPFWQADKPYLHEHHISDARFRRLGYVMAFLAGAINAGGFFAVERYTSHVTGELSHAADMAFIGNWPIMAAALIGVVCFVLGAAHSSWVILWAKRQRFRSSFGLSMWLEAVYILLFGLIGVVTVRFGTVVMPAPIRVPARCNADAEGRLLRSPAARAEPSAVVASRCEGAASPSGGGGGGAAAVGGLPHTSQ